MCYKQSLNQHRQDNATLAGHSVPSILSDESILIAVPGRDDKKIEVYQFPDERLKFIVPRAQSTDTGMVMAVKLVHHPTSNNVLVLAGYEGGLTAVHKLPQNEGGSALELAQLVYLSKPHTQPVLSLDVSPDGTKYFTSSADAIIAAHRIPELLSYIEEKEDLSAFEQINSTQSSSSFDTGKQKVTASKAKPTESLLQVQSDQTLPSSGQDAQPSVELSESSDFSKKFVNSTASSTSISFAKQPVLSSQAQTSKPAGLSSLLSSVPAETKHKPLPPMDLTVTIEQPHKANDTKHAGQQSLTVRSDGRLLVTGGWDSRIRIYSTKTLKEVAVLKWHKEGVYAVGFGEILDAQDLSGEKEVIDDGEAIVTKRETGLGKLQRQREEQMQLKHWVVAGAKDGKVSLWEVF
ncbi:Astra associated protein 1 Asa1 [Neocucurbitaria cava]|uniref:ASTRA-associated protein 1 n=1 Tax=Neocucurbitaria cava TaxID=798079 RepID=A0A9W8Y581_9PLEO|nr:Astra associated protein 1 Asa1 [Neocucurbitaria cava]